MATIQQTAAAVERAHVDGGYASPRRLELRAVLRGLSRKLGGSEGREPLRIEDVVKICDELGRGVRDVRDRAILCVGFSTGLRRSELSGLDLDDVTVLSKGVRVRVGRSKTDQAGVGREVAVFKGKRAGTCPVRALQRWIEIRGRWAGPLFVGCSPSGAATRRRFGGPAIYEMVKRLVAVVGLDPSRYGGHSLRSGMITAAAEAGAPDVMIARRSGHKSLAVMSGYVRGRDIFAYNPLARVL
jgi:integrase